MPEYPIHFYKARGALSNPDGRFERYTHSRDATEEASQLQTRVLPDKAKSVISRNRSPDVPFEYSVNPYRGCEHGCIYCFARPSHAYLGLSPGLDFETRLFYKENAAARLRAELSKPAYRCRPIALGINTDAYQPLERELKITRSLLEVMLAFNQPVSIVTKSALIQRDLDLLQALAERGLVKVMLSITSLENSFKAALEPRAASAAMRIQTLERLHDAGIPAGVLVAPIIPCINDHELEAILDAARQAGARTAGYVLLRLPHEVKILFAQWLQAHYPDKAQHVMSLIRQSHNGKLYDARYGQRMRGSGVYASMLAQRFRLACRKLDLNTGVHSELDTHRFQVPPKRGANMDLFD